MVFDFMVHDEAAVFGASGLDVSCDTGVLDSFDAATRVVLPLVIR
ncbi:hypothetical protein AB0E01_40085 [Nocardia vinacea]